AMHGNLVFADEVLENGLRHMGFEAPGGAVVIVDGMARPGFGEVVVEGLPPPGLGPGVMLPDALIELAGQSANGRLVTGVRRAESSARPSAEVLVGAHDH